MNVLLINNHRSASNLGLFSQKIPLSYQFGFNGAIIYNRIKTGEVGYMDADMINYRSSDPQKLVENRTSFSGDDAVFSIYDTYQEANRVELKSHSPMYCGMIYGKKIIHSGNEDPFSFVPSESLVLPPDETIYIDFPDARL